MSREGAAPEDAGPTVLRHRLRRVAAALLLGGCSFALVSPGLFGSWVYDDLWMLDNYLYDGWEDVATVFEHTAVDYFAGAHGATTAPTASETYRPVTMLGLVATHVSSPEPLTHHLVGWFMHLAVTSLLWSALRTKGLPEPARLLLTVLFLFHPVGVEAYVWINGRSDLSAGMFVAGSALLVEKLIRSGAPVAEANVSPGRRALVVVLAMGLAFGAMASKETSLAAVSAIWVAGSWRAHVNGRGAELRWPLVAAALGVATYLWLWGVVREGPLGGLGSGTPGFLSADLWRFVPKLFAVGVGALLSPHAAPMQSCGWLATRPLSAMEWGCSLLMVLLVVAVVRRRDWSGLLLMGGAAATLAPTALLYNALWLGFDRYLYMPLMLLLLALAPHVVSFVDRADERARRLAAVGGWLLVLVACGATYTASTFYVDQPTWMTSGVSAEPENPTRYVMIARELFDNGHPAEARAALEFLPPPPWPRAVTFALLDLTLKLNSDELYESLLQRASVSEPDHPGVRLHQVHHALHDGDLQRALELVPDLGTTDACAELASHMRAAAPRFTGEERERLTTAFEALPCVHRTAPDPRP